ncbi:ABC transporter ATP-binding protein [Vallitalea longa]|uniref:ABC transporter ATP-binding protein n=1 Tax=Vallitalea longa TaxID=2936439 RepID=A0A9W5Y7Y9_9FIRM|nr:ABC transporter ATP-binding protein [Vallitalea longa]GKX27591.1 ABC transporter ATP-binding protein [Vallitalea longa]
MNQFVIEDLIVGSAARKLVDSVNLSVEEGEIIAITGKSGSGKTLTFMGATGLLTSKELTVTGKIKWNSEYYTPSEMNTFLGKEISYVMQNPMTAFNPVITIGSHCRETLMEHLKVSKKEADKIVIDWFYKLNLNDTKRVYKSYCYELSGGMLQRVMLALAMAVGSKMIIADEPTTALDTITQKKILSEFIRINKEYGVTIIFISHDFGIISQIANHIAVISDGKLIEYGSTEKILTAPEKELTIKMLKELCV